MSDQIQKVYILNRVMQNDSTGLLETSVFSSESDALDAAKIQTESNLDSFICGSYKEFKNPAKKQDLEYDYEDDENFSEEENDLYENQTSELNKFLESVYREYLSWKTSIKEVNTIQDVNKLIYKIFNFVNEFSRTNSDNRIMDQFVEYFGTTEENHYARWAVSVYTYEINEYVVGTMPSIDSLNEEESTLKELNKLFTCQN